MSKLQNIVLSKFDKVGSLVTYAMLLILNAFSQSTYNKMIK